MGYQITNSTLLEICGFGLGPMFHSIERNANTIQVKK
jgi:hypothetical protein